MGGGDNQKKVRYEGDENQERGNWTGRFDFILSCIGFSVGLGNVWRFPYLCQRNGGGSFLIPYAIMLAVCGLPLYYFELAFGQFANLGPVAVWNCVPLFRGVGVAMCVISGFVCIYYNVVIAWAIYYLFASMQFPLPWSFCNNTWNDVRCTSNFYKDANETNVPGNPRNNPFPRTCINSSDTGCTFYQSPSEQYWERAVLGIVSSNNTRYFMDNIGSPQWHLALCLVLAWIIVYCCMIRGIKSSGKVVYFTAVFPYVVLVILLIYSATLKGAGKGVEFYLSPNFRLLGQSTVWSDASVQIFFSLGTGFGGILTMASYNNFKNNCYRDSLIVSFINCGTSIFAGFAVFSLMGYMSESTGNDISKVITSGPGLMFIVYPEGMATMPVAPLWSILFFIMVLTLGLDSEFAMLETVMTSIYDEFPWLTENIKRKSIFLGICCILMFFLGLPMVTRGGLYYFELVNNFCSSYALFLATFCEVMAVSYVYGIKKFCRDIEMMLGHRPGPYWIGCWMFVTPVSIGFIFIFSAISQAPMSLAGYVYPDWGQAFGWLIIAFEAIMIPLGMIYELYKRGLLRVCHNALEEELNWGPAVDKFWANPEFRYEEKLYIKTNNPGLSEKRGGDGSDGKNNPAFEEEKEFSRM